MSGLASFLPDTGFFAGAANASEKAVSRSERSYVTKKVKKRVSGGSGGPSQRSQKSAQVPQRQQQQQTGAGVGGGASDEEKEVEEFVNKEEREGGQRFDNVETPGGLYRLGNLHETVQEILERSKWRNENFNAMSPSDKAKLLKNMACFYIPTHAVLRMDEAALADAQALIQFLTMYETMKDRSAAKKEANDILRTIRSTDDFVTVIGMFGIRRSLFLTHALTSYNLFK